MHRAAWLVALALLHPTAASAIPAFARKYDFSCHNCHARAYPELNAFGRQFLESGYQLPDGAEAAYRGRSARSPGTIAERIGLLRELPLSARAQAAVEIPVDARATARNPVDFRLLENLFLVAGANLWRGISFFAAATLAPQPGLHHAAIGAHNLIFGPGHLNVRLGNLLLLGFLRPDHRSVTRANSLGTQVRVGKNPTVLDTSHLGFEVFGRLFRRHLFYQLAVVQGAQGVDGLRDLDGNKDLFGQLQLTFLERQTLGALFYWGNTQITDDDRGVMTRFTDRFVIAGANAEVNLGPVTVFGAAYYGRHGNPGGAGAVVDYWSWRAQLDLSLLRDLYGIARFDGVHSAKDPSLERRVLAAHLGYLMLTNLRVAVEFQADLAHFERSTGFVLFDLAL